MLGASLRSSLRQTAILIVPIVLVTCATLLNNFFVHRIFALFPAGQTFVLANMIDQGPAKTLSAGGLSGGRLQDVRNFGFASSPILRIPLDNGCVAAARRL